MLPKEENITGDCLCVNRVCVAYTTPFDSFGSDFFLMLSNGNTVCGLGCCSFSISLALSLGMESSVAVVYLCVYGTCACRQCTGLIKRTRYWEKKPEGLISLQLYAVSCFIVQFKRMRILIDLHPECVFNVYRRIPASGCCLAASKNQGTVVDFTLHFTGQKHRGKKIMKEYALKRNQERNARKGVQIRYNAERR